MSQNLNKTTVFSSTKQQKKKQSLTMSLTCHKFSVEYTTFRSSSADFLFCCFAASRCSSLCRFEGVGVEWRALTVLRSGALPRPAVKNGPRNLPPNLTPWKNKHEMEKHPQNRTSRHISIVLCHSSLSFSSSSFQNFAHASFDCF